MSQIELIEANVPQEELHRRAVQQHKRELVGLSDQGFTVCLPEDFDWQTHDPWVVRLDDQTIWKRELGSPPSGYLPATHLVVLPPSSNWFYLTAASATGPKAPRSLHELEERKKRRERAQAEQEAERAKAFQAKKKTARPVLLADLEHGTPAGLRDALEDLDRLGGRVRVASGRVLVEVPPSDLGSWEYGTKRGSTLAAILYRAEAALLEATGGKDGPVSAAKVSDSPLLPSGRVLP